VTALLKLRLFGDFTLYQGNQQVTSLSSARLQSLLAYLVLHSDVRHMRQRVAFLFWPDATEAQARNNLRQLLHQLRQSLPVVERFLRVDATSLQWRADTPFRVDVALFERALGRAREAATRHDRDEEGAALREADSLYRGALLPGCYDEWIMPERERLQQAYSQALEQLLHLSELQGDYVAAIRYAQRLIRIDPLSEDFYRRLMRLHLVNNDRASALRTYHTCAAMLQRELGIEPDPATHAIYEQLLHKPAASGSAVPRQPALTVRPTLVGRRREWENLQAAWNRVVDGVPHFVLITGEAGLGKSRLAEEFLTWVGQHGAITAKTRSYAAEGQLSLAPVTDWLRSEEIRPQVQQLESVWLTEVARVLPELLTERPDIPHFEPLGEYGQRQRFFEALARAVLIAPRPLLLLIDDLQWCDSETLEWLHFLLRFDPGAPLLVVGCARAEELPSDHPLRKLMLHLHNTTAVFEIELHPLDAAETAKLAALVEGSEPELEMLESDIEELMYLYRETGGYPLFVVETVRAGLGRTTDSASGGDSPRNKSPAGEERPLPSRVRAVLENRLQQLSALACEVAELAATNGREFTLDLLVTAGHFDVDSTVHALDELWHKRIVREEGTDSYDFTHDKLREVTYAQISVPQRRLLHRRIATALEASYADDLDSVSGQLAWHYERAGLILEAIFRYQRAAAVAQRLYANEDAIELLRRSLELLEQMPASLKRDKQELSLRLALAPLYRMTKGWAAPELEHVLRRVQVLCDTVGEDTERTEALYGLQSLYLVQAKLEHVQKVSDELHTLYQRSLGIDPPPFSDMMLAGARFHLGQISEANEQFEQATAVYDPDQLLHLQESQGANYAALALAWQSHALWCLGYPQKAYDRGLQAIRLVEDLDQPFNQALVSAYLAMLQQLRADVVTFQEQAERALELGTRYSAPYYRAWSAILVSYAEASCSPDDAHIRNLRESITEFKASGARLRLPYYLSLLAQVIGKAGQITEALDIVDEALSEARTHNERFWDGELHRLRGELQLASGEGADKVEAELLRSVEIAKSKQARSLELRATMSLARFWISQRRLEEAKSHLSAVYAWFTEGFDTPDLQAAQTLLAQL
jgi:DNA-binding SARP family transcriptional activator/predicted ATPase